MGRKNTLASALIVKIGMNHTDLKFLVTGVKIPEKLYYQVVNIANQLGNVNIAMEVKLAIIVRAKVTLIH
jgi:hypothetical protein